MPKIKCLHIVRGGRARHAGAANLQTGDYAAPFGLYNEKANPTLKFASAWPDSVFDPENMAASRQY